MVIPSVYVWRAKMLTFHNIGGEVNNLQKLLESLPEFNWFGKDKENGYIHIVHKSIGIVQGSELDSEFSIHDLILDPRSNFKECVNEKLAKKYRSKEDGYQGFEKYQLYDVRRLLCDMFLVEKGNPEVWAGKVLEWIK